MLSNAPWAMHVLWGMLRHFISKELQERVLIVSAKETTETLRTRLQPVQHIPKLMAGGEAACMPAGDARSCGFDTLDAEQLQSMLVHSQPTATGGEPTGYRMCDAAQ